LSPVCLSDFSQFSAVAKVGIYVVCVRFVGRWLHLMCGTIYQKKDLRTYFSNSSFLVKKMKYACTVSLCYSQKVFTKGQSATVTDMADSIKFKMYYHVLLSDVFNLVWNWTICFMRP